MYNNIIPLRPNNRPLLKDSKYFSREKKETIYYNIAEVLEKGDLAQLRLATIEYLIIAALGISYCGSIQKDYSVHSFSELLKGLHGCSDTEDLNAELQCLVVGFENRIKKSA